MGAGKFLLGEALAKRLGWQLIDANPSIERYIGRNLHDIMGNQGEAAFHQCEGEIISHYLDKEKVVVVLEEAVIATQENRKLLSSEFVVYAKVSIEAQLKRFPIGRSETVDVENDVNKIIKELGL